MDWEKWIEEAKFIGDAYDVLMAYDPSKADILIVIGIGGSYLGAKSVIEALKPYYNNQGVEIIYAGIDLSSDYLNDLINYIKGKSVYINVISKSGTTLEPSVSFDYLLDYMKNNFSHFEVRR